MRTVSLQRRVTLACLGLLAAILAVLGTFVYVALEQRLSSVQRDRLADRAALATELAGSLDSQALADRVASEDVAAAVVRDGAVVARGAPAPGDPADRGRLSGPGQGPGGPAGPRERRARDLDVRASGDLLTLDHTLPDGAVLRLTSSRADARAALSRLLALELGGSLVLLGIAALLLRAIVARALRPLDRVVGVAGRIASGDTRERLSPTRTDTELGRTAVAFDRMLDSLESALDEARASETRMRAFLSDASHELRTPLTGLQGSAETLLRDGDDRERRERLAVQMIRQTARAGRLVDDLLVAARLAEGQALHPELCALTALVEDEVARIRALAPTLDVSLHSSTAGRVRADPQRLGQVLANLLDNARHATPDGGAIRVTVHGDRDLLHVDVADSGPGVPDAERERIFERFVRLDPARARDAFGNGLGLAIAREIARAHGGSLVCCAPSPDGGGARFVLTLPAGDRDAPGRPDPAAPGVPASY